MAQKYGYLANASEGASKPFTCLVCDKENPSYSWTDYSGEGYCTQCGTPYQLQWGKLNDGETYPRINVKKEAIPLFREFWQTTHLMNPCGSIIIWEDYPEKAKVIPEWNKFNDKVKSKYPELFKE